MTVLDRESLVLTAGISTEVRLFGPGARVMEGKSFQH
jgi:hypothetical protein